MYGFPEELYRVHYDAPGSPEITEEIAQSMRDSGRPVTLDTARGYDHGVWSTLVHAFPEHDIPVICMSLDYHMSPREYIELGESIAKLREK